MGKDKKRPPEFPTTVYVRWGDAEPDEDNFLMADEDIEDIHDLERVGVYELRDVRTMHVSRALVADEE